MNITNKTILITGGGTGIGFQFAKLFSEKNNRVIITGRREDRLKQAAAQLKNVSFFVADINEASQADALLAYVEKEHGGLDVLVNNAGLGYAYPNGAVEGTGSYTKAAEEMTTNFLAVVRLTEAALPQLRTKPEAAIVNVTSIVALVPNVLLTTYSASKAALRSYSLSLRHTLSKETNIKIFEIMPPLVDTELTAEIGGATNGIPPAQVAEDLLRGMANEQYELHVGKTADLYKLLQVAPEEAFKAVNP